MHSIILWQFLVTAQLVASQEILSSLGLVITNITGVGIAHLLQRRHACWTDMLEPVSAIILSSPLPSRPTLKRTQPPIERLMRNLSPEFKRKGRLPYYSPHSKPEVKTRGPTNPLIHMSS
jgi:hypothetical protein